MTWHRAAADHISAVSQCAHLNICVASLVQNRAHVLRHEVHAQHSDSAAAALSHVDRRVSHDEGVGDVNVGPALTCCCQHALHLGVHVEVGDHAYVLL